MSVNLKIPDRDLTKGHPLLQDRWPRLLALLEAALGPGSVRIEEVFRLEARQQWLFGGGRTEDECRRYGVPIAMARPTDPKVTNAWSAKTTAHGYTQLNLPAAAALDVVPLGRDGNPWTADDPWQEFVDLVAVHGEAVGLRHFTAPGKPPWDKPHLQLVEWSDAKHTLLLRGT